jgi:ornithine cyclodeaminase/alanine dehydrogenase-like protein (mu-crystallin family)
VIDMLVLSHEDVRRLLPMSECVPAMRDALLGLARDELHQPLRTVLRPPGASGLIAMMPAYRSAAPAVYGLKAVCVHPGNTAIGKDAHQGAVLLFDGTTGEPLAIANASAVTELRTAAVSAVATDVLARPDATTLAIIGAGVQARAHLAAIGVVRPLRSIRVAGRDIGRARQFAREMADHTSAVIQPCGSVEEAVDGADIVVTVTTSAEPVLSRGWLAPGVHVNAVGSSIPTTRELDADTVAAARLFVDRRESALNESGDFLFAAREKGLVADHIRGELGELLAGTVTGRTSQDELTLFISLGLAVEDLAAVSRLYELARADGTGMWVPF